VYKLCALRVAGEEEGRVGTGGEGIIDQFGPKYMSLLAYERAKVRAHITVTPIGEPPARKPAISAG